MHSDRQVAAVRFGWFCHEGESQGVSMGYGKMKAVQHPSILFRTVKEGKSHAMERERPPLFAGILPSEYSHIFAAGHIKEFQRGEILHLEGAPLQQVSLLLSGLVKITKYGMSGTEVILRLGGPGDVLGAADPLCSSTHGTTAEAFRICRALVWDVTSFRTLIAPYPVLHQNIARIVSGYLLELEERFREVATEKVCPRVARQVVRLLEQIGRPVEGAVEIRVSREELAQMTGTTLFTVSRLLSAWEALGVVKPRREAVAVCKVEALRAIARGSEGSSTDFSRDPFAGRALNPLRVSCSYRRSNQ